MTVTWRGDGFTITGSAIARPDYGGILLGPHAAPLFDPAPLDRPGRNTAAWPDGDAGAAPPPILQREADALFAGTLLVAALWGALWFAWRRR